MLDRVGVERLISDAEVMVAARVRRGCSALVLSFDMKVTRCAAFAMLLPVLVGVGGWLGTGAYVCVCACVLEG